MGCHRKDKPTTVISEEGKIGEIYSVIELPETDIV